MKKNCLGCRAFTTFSCALGYKIGMYTINDLVVTRKPLEQCPKPRTYNKYFDLMEERARLINE